MIKHLVLDMGNVLLSWEPEAFALRAAGNEADADILNTALFASPQWPLHDAGQITEEELRLSARSRTPARLHAALDRLIDQWPDWMAPIPGALQFTLRAREAGLGLYLLSNAGTRFPQALLARGIYPPFDGMVVSAHEKLSKPDPRLYQRLCQRFALQPESCLFVDDILVNVQAAQSIGMAAHHFDGDWAPVASRLRLSLR